MLCFGYLKKKKLLNLPCASFPVLEILCGDPPILPHTAQLWSGSSTPGSTVVYLCEIGFFHSGGNNASVCTNNGYWIKPDILCKGNIFFRRLSFFFHILHKWITFSPFCECIEVDCGEPLPISNSFMLWDQVSTVGSKVAYKCAHGYANIGKGNVSVCTASGQWDGVSLSCQGDNHIHLYVSVMSSCIEFPSNSKYSCTTEAIRSLVPGHVTWVSVCFTSRYQCSTMTCCLLVVEINCGEPLFKQNAIMFWNGTSRVGSVVYYQCEEGYYTRGMRNYSKCGENGLWEDVDLWCEGINLSDHN